MTVLVTGGAGYIGSHTVKLLMQNNIDVVVLDNLSRGHVEAVPAGVPFEKVGLLNYQELLNALKKYEIDSVIHFAAFTYVGESVEKPFIYYQNNVVGTFNLLNAMRELNIKNIVFSSTCSVYGNPEQVPISEFESTKPINPYAETKLIIEHILRDYETAYGFKYIALRYFNAAGADPKGLIGESHDPEPHLIPLILRTALGLRSSISVFGTDYETNDGTCIRDYIHVNDLANAHYLALKYLKANQVSQIINLGTGKGNSVLEVIKKAEEVTGRKIQIDLAERRAGDPAVLVADNKKAKEVIGWQPVYSIDDVLTHAWKWHSNPKY
jgi:UDP-glucose 4-epimerase